MRKNVTNDHFPSYDDTALFIQLAAGTILMGIAYFCPAWIAVIVELIIFACA